jgi:DNA-binding IclR family transcriptional regulator
MIFLDSASRQYFVSIGALAIYAGLQSASGAYLVAKRELDLLSQESQETSGLDLSGGSSVTVVVQVAGPRIIGQMPKPVPRTMSAITTSTGKVFTAWAEPTDVRTWFNGTCSNKEIDRIIRDAAETRLVGFAKAIDEVEVGAAAIGAPVLISGRAIAAVWVGGPTFRFTPDRIPALAHLVRRTAGRLSELFSLDGGSLLAQMSTASGRW